MDVPINIFNDAAQEEEERFTVELTAFDHSIILVNNVAEVVIQDNDGMKASIAYFLWLMYIYAKGAQC